MTVFVRGSTLYFSAACKRADGTDITPDTANLYLVYTRADGARFKETIAMAISGANVTAEWDSSVASPTTLHWSIRAAAGASKIAQDGEIDLSGNESNPSS